MFPAGIDGSTGQELDEVIVAQEPTIQEPTIQEPVQEHTVAEEKTLQEIAREELTNYSVLGEEYYTL